MKLAVVAGTVLLVAAVGLAAVHYLSDDDKKPASSGSHGAACTAGSAKAVSRAQISESGLAPTCVKLPKGGSFTLVNADAHTHNFSTSKASPVQLQVDLKKGAAFPYRFTKLGTYTLTDAKSHLVLTVIVR
jgi:plastocyanin